MKQFDPMCHEYEDNAEKVTQCIKPKTDSYLSIEEVAAKTQV